MKKFVLQWIANIQKTKWLTHATLENGVSKSVGAPIVCQQRQNVFKIFELFKPLQ